MKNQHWAWATPWKQNQLRRLVNHHEQPKTWSARTWGYGGTKTDVLTQKEFPWDVTRDSSTVQKFTTLRKNPNISAGSDMNLSAGSDMKNLQLSLRVSLSPNFADRWKIRLGKLTTACHSCTNTSIPLNDLREIENMSDQNRTEYSKWHWICCRILLLESFSLHHVRHWSRSPDSEDWLTSSVIDLLWWTKIYNQINESSYW